MLTFPVIVKPFTFMPTLPFQPLSAPTTPDFHPWPSSPERRRQIQVARLNPGIPERLIAFSDVKTGRREGGEGNTYFHFFSLFPKRHKAVTLLFVLWFCQWWALTDPHVCVPNCFLSNCENCNDLFHIHGLQWINYNEFQFIIVFHCIGKKYSDTHTLYVFNLNLNLNCQTDVILRWQ